MPANSLASDRTADDAESTVASNHKSDQPNPPESATIEQQVETELDRLGQGGRWVWALFLIATVPNIVNGFHVSSYVFLGRMPDEYWCSVPALQRANWTKDNIIEITSVTSAPAPADPIDACYIRDFDYSYLSTLSVEQALSYAREQPEGGMRSCLNADGISEMLYELDGTSIVPEWDLVCGNSAWRTVVQMIISLGKCIGASSVGIASDRFGRRKLFAYGAILFTVASLVTTFSPWYWLFLIGRFCLGSSASGLFYPALIMMSENVASKHRAWMGVAFNISYPLGMLYLALAANFLTSWRDLQLALTIPVVFLPLFWYIFKESPRWLLSKGRPEQAYRVVFGKRAPASPSSANLKTISSLDTLAASQNLNLPNTESTTALTAPARRSSGGLFAEIRGLYSSGRITRIAFICHFAFFTASFSYYVTALNATNLSTNKVVYVSATGCVDIVAYLSGVLLLRYVGRKWSCFWSFTLAATCMLVILALPTGHPSVVAIAMVGRLGVSCVYAIIALYTAELFPTEVRNSAVGVSSMFGHMGSMMAPFVVDFLGTVAWYIPTTICGIALFGAALLVLLNPETQQQRLQDHVGGVEGGEVEAEEVKRNV